MTSPPPHSPGVTWRPVTRDDVPGIVALAPRNDQIIPEASSGGIPAPFATDGGGKEWERFRLLAAAPILILILLYIMLAGHFYLDVGRPTGGGKTTISKLIPRFYDPDAGSVRVLGLDSAREPQRVQSAVGYMPQRDLLLPWRSVLENVALGLELGHLGGQPGGDRAQHHRDHLVILSILRGLEPRQRGQQRDGHVLVGHSGALGARLVGMHPLGEAGQGKTPPAGLFAARFSAAFAGGRVHGCVGIGGGIRKRVVPRNGLVVHQASGQMVGIHMGRLGFLAELQPDEWFEAVVAAITVVMAWGPKTLTRQPTAGTTNRIAST